MPDVITVHCPSCETAFPVDPDKVPEGGVNARCSECSGIFRVDAPAASSEWEADNDAGWEPETTDASWEAETVGTEADTALAEPDTEPEAEEEVSSAEADEGSFQPSDYFSSGDPGAAVEEVEEEPAEIEEEPTLEVDAGIGAEEVEEESAVEPEPPPSRPAFGSRTPEQKAERLARVLVSDMITYNPQMYERAREEGTIEEDFADEIQKSWEEYVDQVGQELADSTSYWKDALNDILAKGDDIF